MVEENDIINRSFWIYPYLAYVIWTQLCVCLYLYNERISQHSWNLKHEILLEILVYTFFIHLFLHNLCVLNSNLSDNILYLATFKLAKHKMATKMFRKLRIFHSLSNIKAQFMVSAIFSIDNCFLGSLERNDLYLTAAVFYVFTVTICILLNMLTIIWPICSNIVL